MTTGPVRASSGWLRLREPADAAARASELVETVRSYLPTHDGATIHDLGCGTGSMARWLAVRLPGPQHWVMYDRDDELLTLAAADPPDRASDGTPVTMETRRRDITRMELAGAALITASALLDMMTAEELQRLVATCAGADCPVLIALSVTGCVEITPAEPFDQRVTDAFNAHQRRTTSAGRASRSRRGRRRGRRLHPARTRSPGPPQPVAARPRSRRSRGRVVHRLAGRGMRAVPRAAGPRSVVRKATPGRGSRRPPVCHRAPPGSAGAAEMTAQKSTGRCIVLSFRPGRNGPRARSAGVRRCRTGAPPPAPHGGLGSTGSFHRRRTASPGSRPRRRAPRPGAARPRGRP